MNFYVKSLPDFYLIENILQLYHEKIEDSKSVLKF